MTGDGLVLVIGLANDPVVATVQRALKALGAEVVHWNQRDLLNDCAFSVRGTLIDGYLLAAERMVPLSAIRGVFNRASSVELTPEYRALPVDDPLADHAQAANARLAEWCEIVPCVVMNRGWTNESNSAKAYQAQLIQPFFDVPDTLVTNDPEAVRRFAETRERVVFKSCSGERSIVTELALGDIDRKREPLRSCPVLFQEYVEGQDVRVHVIGETAIATAVSSGETDYRYDPSSTWKAYELSAETAAASIALARSMDLELAGIDLRLTKDGRAFCFEVNPSPAFSVYEDASGQDIGGQVAKRLSGLA